MAKKPKHSRKGCKDSIGIAMLCISFAIILSGLAAFLYFKNQETIAKQFIVVLLDVTDNLSLQEKQAVLNNFEDLVLTAPSGTSFQVFRVQEIGATLLAPIGTAFTPIQGNQEVNILIAHPREQKQRWLQEFRRPLMEALELGVKSPSAERSPIMESIQSVALTELLGPNKRSWPRSLVVVSDLLQHTDEFSFYKGIPEFSSLSANANYSKLKTNLSGVDVKLWVLRNHTKDASKLADLWKRIIFDQGGSVTGTIPIP
jgi:hypothetical protein